MFVLTTSANIFVRHDPMDRIPKFLLIDALIWCVSGAACALWVWSRCEKRFSGPTIR